MNKKFDLTGKRFGKLTVIRYAGTDCHGRLWLCQCDCGVQKIVKAKYLKNKVKSCGCLNGQTRSRYRPTENDFFEDNGVIALRTAILNQAALDYRNGNDKQRTVLEDWFLSEWGQFLSNDMGEVIIERLKRGE